MQKQHIVILVKTVCIGILAIFFFVNSKGSWPASDADPARKTPCDSVNTLSGTEYVESMPWASKGRLVIPDLHISVALYDVSGGNDEEMQDATDGADSAAWIDWSSAGHPEQPVIADHNDQGFDRLKGAVPGKTLAYIEVNGVRTWYRCLANEKGKNQGDHLEGQDGRNVMEENLDGIAAYTCLADWKHVRIVEWEPVHSDAASDAESAEPLVR